ncbi:MAG: hypothetical protein FJ381_06015 [Verrucomicrobia bacterium]|nr:hypothetical protein [Verrucomicrobiota bacterium]
MPPARVLALALTLAAPALAAAPAPAAAPLAAEARAGLARATAFLRGLSAGGGYLWRYSPDLRERAGENAATPTQVWVQPPGTPAVGQAFLRAWEVTGDPAYLDAAQAAADALATGQLESGGWDYLIDFDPVQASASYRRTDVGRISPAEAAKRKNSTTFDDDNTQSAIRLLVAVAAATPSLGGEREARLRAARDYGLRRLLEAQRPNGGWPQRWNGQRVDPAAYPVRPAQIPTDYPREHPKTNYNSHYTLNDNAQRDIVLTLLGAARAIGNAEYRAAALRGVDFLLLAQLPEPQPVWAQQYNPQFEPAWARAFEPPSVCSSESVGALSLLIETHIETGDARYLAAVPRALAWFERAEIAPGRWARMYELGTNRPVYGDRDGRIKYRLEDLSEERRTGYSWESDYGVPSLRRQYEEVRNLGCDALLAKRRAAEEKARSLAGRAAQARALEPKVRAVLAALDSEGRWLAPAGRRSAGPWITTSAYIANARLLCDYLEAVRP